jgi:2-iminobutanoate/2-iminopropanoate deaminase
MSVEAVKTSAKAAGPYTPAVRAGDWIVVSGQIGTDPATGELAGSSTEDQVRQALANLAAVISDCGCTWEHVAKTTLFVAADAAAVPEINGIYEEVLGEHRPARSTMGVAWLPKGAAFEIEAWVYKPLIRPEA